MINTDVQLINVALDGDVNHIADFPYGMALITAYLRSVNIKTLMLQYPVSNKEDFIGEIIDNPALVYGFQVNFSNYDEIRALVGRIKRTNADAIVIYGGPFVVPFYSEILRHDPDVDAIVLGEGEYTVAELVARLKTQALDWGRLHGIAWFNGTEVITNPHRKAIQNMDEMPFAARDNIERGAYDHEGKYIHDVRITTSRGCTSHCTFCSVNLNSKWQRAKRWRGRSPENVVDEMEWLSKKHHVRLFNLQDSSFTDPGDLGPIRNRRFCEDIIDRNIPASMFAYLQARGVKDDPQSVELYKLYKEAGIDIVLIGAEAGSDHELELYRKGATTEDNYRSFNTLQDLDLFFVHNGFIMFGPYSTTDTLRRNIEFLYRTNLSFHYHNLHVSIILTPGAALHDEMLNSGRVIKGEMPWSIPTYRFDDPVVPVLISHYAVLQEIYPHLVLGNRVVVEAENLISRLKNRMNSKVRLQLEQEIHQFEQTVAGNRKQLSELGYYGFLENLNRVQKDGANADLIAGSEPYFGPQWGRCVEQVAQAYQALLGHIKGKGFGLGGLVFSYIETSFEKQQHT
jgi:anaerobic magnesium-protoporphyrin IX monomethyl ester cyclase